MVKKLLVWSLFCCLFLAFAMAGSYDWVTPVCQSVSVGGGGNVSGVGLANHIAFWIDGENLSYDSNELYYNPTIYSMGLGSISTSWGTLTIESQNDDDVLSFKEDTGSEHMDFEIDVSGDMGILTDSGTPAFKVYDNDGDVWHPQESGFQSVEYPVMGVHTDSFGCDGFVIEGEESTITVDDGNCVIYCCHDHPSYSTATINLPKLRDFEDMHIWVKHLGGDECTCVIDPYSTETVDGNSTYTLSTAFNAVHIHAENNRNYPGWYIIGGYGIG